MKIGFSVDPAKPMLKEMEWIGRNEFAFFECYAEGIPELSRGFLGKIERMKEKYSLGAVGHLSWHFQTGNPDKKKREDAIKRAIFELDEMKKIGVGIATVHANWHPLIGAKESIDIQSESLKEIREHALKNGILLVLENTDTQRDTEKNIKALLDAVPGLMLNLDIGHANLSSRNPASFIEKFRSRISHVHMHDNDGITDMHLPIGQGIIDWKSVIGTLKKHYDGTITLEIFHGGKEFVLLSRKRFLGYWNSA